MLKVKISFLTPQTRIILDFFCDLRVIRSYSRFHPACLPKAAIDTVPAEFSRCSDRLFHDFPPPSLCAGRRPVGSDIISVSLSRRQENGVLSANSAKRTQLQIMKTLGCLFQCQREITRRHQKGCESSVGVRRRSTPLRYRAVSEFREVRSKKFEAATSESNPRNANLPIGASCFCTVANREIGGPRARQPTPELKFNLGHFSISRLMCGDVSRG